MHKKISFILLSLAMLLVIPLTALAIVTPHTNVNQVGCSSCHNATASAAATSFSNMCTTCHKPGSANANVTSRFYQTDAANVFNRFNGYSNGVLPPGKLKWTSHNWAGDEVAPQAGADRPTNPLLNPATLGTNISCARCHNIHGEQTSPKNSAPFLRSLNDNDEMCMDCHRSRDLRNPMLGTHPVNFNYTSASSKVKTKSVDYYNPPRNANPANPTSAMKFVNGKMVCTSCHGVHFTDSNSGTVDNRAQWANLSSSRGMLLRSDTFGKTDASTSVNICTNCHNKPNHQVYAGSKTATNQIQCVDCHSGHVEYLKPEDVALGGDNAKPNVYMLRRYVNYSAGVKLNSYRRKAFLTSTSSTAVLKNANGTAICQACHALPNTVSEHATVSTADQCNNCHGGLHATTPPQGCTGCHGSPPQHTIAGTIKSGINPSQGYAVYSSVNNTALISRSYALSAMYKNESTAGHPTHAAGKPYSFACSQCHNKSDTTHKKQSYQDVPFTAAGTYSPATVFTPGNTTSTCASTYCHSYGTATLTKSKTVSWAAGVRGSIVGSANRCVACHNGVIAGFNNLSTNSHFQHVNSAGKNIGCTVCHTATVSANNVISNYGNHVNNSRDLAFSGTPGAGSVWNGSTCTSACHSDGKGSAPVVVPTWSNRASGKCNTCHLTATSAPALASGSHTTHFAVVGSTDPAVVCIKCHLYTGETAATHVNGTLDPAVTTCATNLCHGSIPNPAWGNNTANTTCTKCHGTGTGTVTASTFEVVAPSGASSDTGQVSTGKIGAHQTHLKYFNGLSAQGTDPQARCQVCHTVPASGSHSNGSSIPVFSGLATTSAGGTYATSYSPGTCSVYCHNPAGTNGTLNPGNAPAVTTVSWIDANYILDGPKLKTEANCNKCHKSPGDVAGAIVIAGTDHNSVKISDDCAGCHGHNGDASGIAGQQHMDGIKYGNGSCDTCHGYPPVSAAEMSTIGTPGAGNYANARLASFNGSNYLDTASSHHATHVLATVTAADGFTPCLPCHPSTSHHPVTNTVLRANVNVNDAADVTFRFDDSRSKRYNTVTLKCSNVSCHFQPTPAW